MLSFLRMATEKTLALAADDIKSKHALLDEAEAAFVRILKDYASNHEMKKLATKIVVTPQYLCDVKGGKRRPSLELARKLSGVRWL
jgi:hypothetical protein